MLERELSVTEEYHFASKNNGTHKFIKNQHLVHYRDDILRLKNVETIQVSGKNFKLPQPSDVSEISLAKVFFKRKSERDFNDRPISTQNLSDLLYYSNGYKNPTSSKKYVPTSGGLNSVESFVIILSSEEFERGIYHYNPKGHFLTLTQKGNFKVWVEEHVFYQQEYASASVIIVLASAFGKLARKYGHRAYRLSLLDVGHVSQNIYLMSAALNLKACASAGFIDDELNEALQLDGFNMASFLTLMIG